MATVTSTKIPQKSGGSNVSWTGGKPNVTSITADPATGKYTKVVRSRGGSGGVVSRETGTSQEYIDEGIAKEEAEERQAEKIQQQLKQRQIVESAVAQRGTTQQQTYNAPINVNVGDYYKFTPTTSSGTFLSPTGQKISETRVTLVESPTSRTTRELQEKYEQGGLIKTEESGGKVFVGTPEQYNMYVSEFKKAQSAEGAWRERELTKPEFGEYRKTLSVVSPTTISPLSKFKDVSGINVVIGNISGSYNQVNAGISERIEPAMPTIDRIIDVGVGTGNLGVGGLPYIPQKYAYPIQRYEAGIIKGVFSDVQQQPLKYGLLFGTSVVGGWAIRGATVGIKAGATTIGSAITGAKWGKAIGTTAELGFTGAVYGTGIYYGAGYVSERATNIYGLVKLKQYEEAGKLTGVSVAELGTTLYGFKIGAKGYDITEGLVRTRGRTFIDIPQGEYPQAPVKMQLELFRKNIYPELSNNKKLEFGEELFKRKGQWVNLKERTNLGQFNKWTNIPIKAKPGAFHTTGDVFWKKGLIIPEAGSSELPGLYGGTQISTPFARIPGSDSLKFNLANFFKSLFTPSGKPGVAYLQPKGFRYSPAKPGRWFLPTKQGFADVPGIKTEIEAVFRPGAGDYSIVSKGFYTKIKGVRVPIDTFIYDVGSGQRALLNDIKFVQENYNLLEKYGIKTKLTKGHGGEHLYAVKENVGKLIDLYPEYHGELIKTYGSLTEAKSQLSKGALLHDIGKTTGSSFGDYHGERVANVLSSGKLNIKLNQRVIDAIYYHEKTFGAVTPEGKILATADRLDLIRFGKRVKPELLPLSDALSRINKQEINLKGGQGSYSGYNPSSYSRTGISLISISEPDLKIKVSSISSSKSSVISSASYIPSISSIAPTTKSSRVSSRASSISSLSSAMSSIKSSRVSSKVSLSKAYSYKPSSVRKPYAYTPYKKQPKFPTIFKSQGRKLFNTANKIPVYGRRFGKFKVIGLAKSESEAFNIGKRFARNTLGVSFKIPSAKSRKLSGYKTKIEKGIPVYIEPRGKRLKRRGFSLEVPEIQLYKGLKGGRKRK